MKMIILFALFSLLEALQAKGAITTIYVQASTNGVRSSMVTVKSNEIAQVRYLYTGMGATLFVNDGTTTYPLYGIDPSSTWNIPLIAGPVTIYLESRDVFPNTNTAICTISVAPLADTSAGISIPSNAVVIPADSGGPVQIILESSADLITWTAATPGTYGAQTQTRFFRVRAQHVAN